MKKTINTNETEWEAHNSDRSSDKKRETISKRKAKDSKYVVLDLIYLIFNALDLNLKKESKEQSKN